MATEHERKQEQDRARIREQERQEEAHREEEARRKEEAARLAAHQHQTVMATPHLVATPSVADHEKMLTDADWIKNADGTWTNVNPFTYQDGTNSNSVGHGVTRKPAVAVAMEKQRPRPVVLPADWVPLVGPDHDRFIPKWAQTAATLNPRAPLTAGMRVFNVAYGWKYPSPKGTVESVNVPAHTVTVRVDGYPAGVAPAPLTPDVPSHTRTTAGSEWVPLLPANEKDPAMV